MKTIQKTTKSLLVAFAACCATLAFGLNSAQAAAPEVAITSPAAGAPVDDLSFTIAATASDSDGTITSVTFYDGATQLGDPVTTPPYTRTITGATLGAHVLTAKAIDNDSNETVSAAVTVRAATNLLLNKTVACQHYYYGGAGQGGLVDNKPSTFNFFSRIPDNWTPDNDLRVSVSNFNSAVGKVRYWGEYYKGTNCRSLNSVTIYSSTTATTSLATGDYTLCGTFSIPLNNVFIPPAGWTTVPGVGNYYDFPISAPSGTKSLLLTFGNTGIPGNIANNINEIQAFPPPPAPPVVAITSPLESASVPAAGFAIDATATDEGSITSVTFFIDDVQIGDPDTAPPYSIVMVGATPGARVLTAKAIDNDLNEVTSTAVNVTVTASNQAPVATLTSPADAASYVQGMSIPLAATATDDGGVASVTFYYNGGSGDVQIGDPVTIAPYTSTWTGATTGSYTVTAVARDFLNVPSAPSSVSITVTANQPPVATLTSPADLASYVEGVNIPLAATATDDVGVTSVTFFYNDGGADVQIGDPVTTAPYTLTWTGATLGSHTVKAVALDTGGLYSAPSSVSITVTANQPPYNVAITSPAAGSTLAQNYPFTISATAQTDNGTLTKVEFYDGATLVGTDTTDPYSCAATFAETGDHALTAKAFSAGGYSTVSAPVHVTVVPNLLENKTVACQHYWYGENNQAGLVNNNPSTFNLFSGALPDTGGANWTPDPDLRVSVSGFNSDVATLRYWGGTSYGTNCRSLNGVTIYSSATSTTSLDPADYTLCGTFPILLNNGSSLPAGWVQDSVGRCYYDIAISAPAGTQSLLLMFANAGISGNIANNITKIQAFASSAPPVAGYDAWAGPDGYDLTGADADRNADPDGDRFTNIQEFLFGSSPIAGNGSLVNSETSGGNLVLRWLQRVSGSSYLLKESATMNAGDWSTSAVVPADDADQTGVPADYVRRKAVITTGETRMFFRVEGTEN